MSDARSNLLTIVAIMMAAVALWNAHERDVHRNTCRDSCMATGLVFERVDDGQCVCRRPSETVVLHD